MPRTLPWEKSRALADETRPKKAATPSTNIYKKVRVTSTTPSAQTRSKSPTRNPGRNNSEHPTSSSPPPEAPEESYMIEGLDHDDKYRMVEDEFLAVAQSFTAHLHAAEYKRQQRMVKTRNAETISSISRPVTGKMPDQTKRRVESVARSKKQGTAIEKLMGKSKPDKDRRLSDDSDDGLGLPYTGTTLHGLMDSPRKKAASISRAVPIVAATRAAAGFNKPKFNSKSDQGSVLKSPRPRNAPGRAPLKIGPENETSEDDDDLDAPIPAPKLFSKNVKSGPVTKTAFKVEISPEDATKKSLSTQHSSSPNFVVPAKNEWTSPGFDDIPDFLAQIGSRPSRVARARQRRSKHKSAESDTKKLDEIPDFF